MADPPKKAEKAKKAEKQKAPADRALTQLSGFSAFLLFLFFLLFFLGTVTRMDTRQMCASRDTQGFEGSLGAPGIQLRNQGALGCYV